MENGSTAHLFQNVNVTEPNVEELKKEPNMIMAQSIHCVCCLPINYQTQSLTQRLS